MYRKKVLCGMLIGAISITATAVADNKNTCVGIVTDYKKLTGDVPNSKNYYIVKRNGKEEPVELMMRLNEGDKLELKHCNINTQLSVTIELAEKTIVVACKNDDLVDCTTKDIICDSFLLTKAQSYSLLQNFANSVWRKIGSLFDDLHNERARTELATLAGRPAAPTSPRLFSPVLGSSGSRLSAGPREFFLAWVGGKPPYSVHIRDTQTGSVLAQSTHLQQPRVNLGMTNFSDGRYQVEISDSAGQRLERLIDIVPPSALPKLLGTPKDRPASARDKRLLETVYAAWLLDQNQRLWSLEAYQRVVGSAQDNYPAQLLKQKLEGTL